MTINNIEIQSNATIKPSRLRARSLVYESNDLYKSIYNINQ